MTKETEKNAENLCVDIHEDLKENLQCLLDNHLYEVAKDIVNLDRPDRDVICNIFGEKFVNLCDNLMKAYEIFGYCGNCEDELGENGCNYV